MYPLFNTSTLILTEVVKLIVSTDNNIKYNEFIFIQMRKQWLQVYIDENVLFIVELDRVINITEYLQELDQSIAFQRDLTPHENLTLNYAIEEQKLELKTSKLPINFLLKNDQFQLTMS